MDAAEAELARLREEVEAQVCSRAHKSIPYALRSAQVYIMNDGGLGLFIQGWTIAGWYGRSLWFERTVLLSRSKTCCRHCIGTGRRKDGPQRIIGMAGWMLSDWWWGPPELLWALLKALTAYPWGTPGDQCRQGTCSARWRSAMHG
jgi:hypothetical protein